MESLIYLKASLKIVVFSWYVRKSLPFVSSFTSILMLEGSQLRLSNNIFLLSVYLSLSQKKWWEFSHGAPQLQEVEFSHGAPQLQEVEFSHGAPQLQEVFDTILTLHKS